MLDQILLVSNILTVRSNVHLSKLATFLKTNLDKPEKSFTRGQLSALL